MTNESLENVGKMFKLDDINMHRGTGGVFSSTHRTPSGVYTFVRKIHRHDQDIDGRILLK